MLEDWIQRDKLTCLKIKLRGDDARWDYQRIDLASLKGPGFGYRIGEINRNLPDAAAES